MARCCGSSGTCACKIAGGRNVEVTGTGTAQDPFVVAAQGSSMEVADTDQFDLVLTGEGTLQSPWFLQVNYADTAALDNIPDVDDTNPPANGQVLAWNDTTNMWEPVNPTTAAAGSSLTDGQSVDGDGSAGDPLRAVADAARYITITASGLGLSDAGINRMVRIFPDAAARAAATLAPEEGTISVLTSDPDRIDFWDGTEWQTVSGMVDLDVTGEFMQLSGVYPPGRKVTQYVRQLSVVSDTNGEFDAIPAADIAAYAGVLSVQVSPSGATPWQAMVDADTANDKVVGTAYRMDDGTPLAGFTVTGTVTALLY